MGLLNSYSQIFFSKNKILGILLLLVSFFDFWTGLGGLLAVLVSNQTAIWFKFNKLNIEKGLYGFNSLLVGLGTGIMFQPSLASLFLLIVLAIFTLFVTLTIEGVFTKYGLPYISIPFILVMWTANLAMSDLWYIGVSQRGIYFYNELYALGGQNFVDFYNWISSFQTPASLRIYFLSLGAILFQFNELAGIIIAIALLFSSRIAFTLSLVGFYVAYLFYQLLGVNFSELSYTYIGFNYILTAIAIGGFFFVPSRWSYLWLLLLLPITVILTFGLSKFFSYYQLSIYSLPFNITVLLFVYVMKLRTQTRNELVEPIEQRNAPEENLYFHKNVSERFPSAFYLPVYLPFLGEWTVSQAHAGEHTHKGEWQHAWDFVITDNEGKQFQNKGDFATDYFCYNKPVVASADGIVAELVDGIADNIIGDINTINNWGNSLVIKHSDYLYSQISHLKQGGFKVKKGEFVRKGQMLATCGNSGRSPYPHLHFQFQATPFIGSKTFFYPFAHLIKKENKYLELKTLFNPQQDERLQNVASNNLLLQAFHFIPGQVLKFNTVKNGSELLFEKVDDFSKIIENEWEIRTSIYNVSYFYCKKTNSSAFFKNDELLFQFINFEGNKNSALYFFYLAFYKVQLGFYNGLTIEDKLPQNNLFSQKRMIFQDFVAPFYLFLKAQYKLNYLSVDDEFSPEEIKLKSEILSFSFNKKIKQISFEITININGIRSFLMK